MKNSSDAIGNRTRDLPACSAVPQTTAQACAHIYIYMCVCVCVCKSFAPCQLYIKWIIWFYVVLIWFGSPTIIHCGSKYVGLSEWYDMWLRRNIVHFVGWVLRIDLMPIDLTSLRMPGVSRTWLCAFFLSLNRPECTMAFGNGTDFRNLVVFREYGHSQSDSIFMFPKFRRKSRLAHVWINYIYIYIYI